MTISLVRHGRPLVDYRTRVAGAAFGSWLDAYEHAGIDALVPPPPDLRATLGDCELVVTSCSRRSIDSADMLALRASRVALADAGEAPLPRRVASPIKLKPLSLTVIARISWLAGLSRSAESKHDVQARARRFAAGLEVLAADAGHVAVVGHGYYHRFTAEALRSAGWSGSQTGRGYWSCFQLTKAKPNDARAIGPEPTGSRNRS